MMYRRVTLIGLLGISLVAMWAVEASAHSGGMTLLPNGTQIHTSSVRCNFQATGAGGNATTGTCEVFAGDESILFCLNPADHLVDGEASDIFVTFGTAIGISQPGIKDKNKRTYEAVSKADGLASSDAECDQDPDCVALRVFCRNPNWVPFDVVPVNMTVVIKVYACTSKTACPCSPTPTEENNLPVCLDHDTSDPEIDPEASLTYQCTFPQGVNPDNFDFGTILQYACVLVP